MCLGIMAQRFIVTNTFHCLRNGFFIDNTSGTKGSYATVIGLWHNKTGNITYIDGHVAPMQFETALEIGKNYNNAEAFVTQGILP